MAETARATINRQSGRIKDRIGYVEIYELDEYENLAEIIKSFKTGQYSFQNPIFQTAPDWDIISRNSLVKAKNKYVYIFRKYENFATLYTEFYANDSGEYEYFDESDDRKSTSHKNDQIAIPIIDEGRTYQYYLWTSPFRLSYPRIDRILEFIKSKSLFEVGKILPTFAASDFQMHLGSGVCYENNVLKVLIPDYLGYVTKLYNTLVVKLEDLYNFVNPQDEASQKIRLFSEMIHNAIVRDGNLTDRIKEYNSDETEINNELNNRTFGVVTGIEDTWTLQWRDRNGNMIEPYDAEKHFRYTADLTYLRWRFDLDLRLKYLQEQAEIIAKYIIDWIQLPGFAYSLSNLLYGSFSGGDARRAQINLDGEDSIDSIKGMIFSGDYFNKKEAGDIFEAFKGIIFEKLDETQAGQNFLRNFIISYYNENLHNSETYPEYFDMLEDDPGTQLDTKKVLKGIFKTTRTATKGLATLMGSFSIHIMTYTYKMIEIKDKTREVADIFKDTYRTVNNTVFSARKVQLVPNTASSSTGTVTSVFRRTQSVSLFARSGKTQISAAYTKLEEFKITSDLKQNKDLIRSIGKFNSVMDKINIGLGALQIVAICGKDEHNIQDMLVVSGFCMDLYKILGNVSKTGTKVLGGAGAAISAVNSGISSYKESQEGDTDSAVFLGISAGGSVISLVGIIIGLAATAPAWVSAAAVVAVVGGIIAAVAGLISIFLDDAPIELLLKNCFWGTEYPNESTKTTSWSLIPLHDWSLRKRNQQYLPRHVGNIDIQIEALNNVVYSYTISKLDYYHFWPDGVLGRLLPGCEPVGLIYFTIKTGLLQRDSIIEAELSITQNDQVVPETTYNMTLEGGKNILYNLPAAPVKDSSVLEDNEGLSSLTCIVASNKNSRKNTIKKGLDRIMYGDNPATNSRKNRFFGYVEESSIDYFSKLEELYQQDNHADYKIQIVIKLYPGGKITNAESIDKTETTNC